MEFNNIKKIWKEHKKEIIFSVALGVIGGLTVKNSHDIATHKRVANLNVDRINNHLGLVYDGEGVLAENVNYLASKMDLPEGEWSPIIGKNVTFD